MVKPHLHQVEAIEDVLLGELAPQGGGGAGFRQPSGAVDEEEGLVVDADVARVVGIEGRARRWASSTARE